MHRLTECYNCTYVYIANYNGWTEFSRPPIDCVHREWGRLDRHIIRMNVLVFLSVCDRGKEVEVPSEVELWWRRCFSQKASSRNVQSSALWTPLTPGPSITGHGLSCYPHHLFIHLSLTECENFQFSIFIECHFL